MMATRVLPFRSSPRVPASLAALCLLAAASAAPVRADEPVPVPPATTVKASATAQRLPAAEGAGLRIVLVEWKIKKGREQDFVDYWSKRATVASRDGLIAEFLATPETTERWPWISWPTPTTRPDFSLYYNVGLWRDDATFQEQVGRFIDPERSPLDFEAEKRSRILLAPQRWRAGLTAPPPKDSAETR